LLLVDDEHPIRQLIARTLEADGYLVIEAADGASAWDLWRARSDEICLVISDIRMPGIGGHELAERIRSHPAPPPILFISGYGEEGLWLPGPLLPKPFQLDALLAEVQRLIAANDRDMLAS
jgi:CheY-like chemotaxis protein